tara:strand:- start:64 stop:306 length:243 start_codon:yes stop_codon:yes gene_type:complete
MRSSQLTQITISISPILQKNPKVNIQYPDNIDATVAFFLETESNKITYAEGTYHYNGLIFSGQEIRIRWWEKAKLNDWLN